MECPFLKTCIFFQGKMQNMPTTANIMKKRYCLEDNSKCARFMIANSPGRQKVPTDLLPNRQDRAEKTIKEKRERIMITDYNDCKIEVPPNPAKDRIKAAKSLLEDDVLADFDFATPADKAHAVAYILLFLCREMIDGPTPLHIFESADRTPLAELIMDVLTAGRYATFSERNDRKLEKQIFNAFSNGMSGFCLNNISELNSPLLSCILLAHKYTFRIPRKYELINAVIRWVWAATGNNIVVNAEITRRSIRIRFYCNKEYSELSSRFRSNANKIIESGLTLIQAWIAAGQPMLANKNLGGFEKWSETIGSILTFHGFSDFLGNTDNLYEEKLQSSLA